jgi:sugar-specific transcriptional regulator TrmB
MLGDVMEGISVEEALFSFGLSPKEIKVYLSCLELGSATAQEISDKSYLNRSTTYDVLKALLEKGLAAKVFKEKTTFFEVARPEKLLFMLDEKKEKLSSVIKQLKLMQEYTIRKPVVQVYQGKEGFKTILDDILATKQQTDVISTSAIFTVMKTFFPYYIKQRAELKIFSRVIQEFSEETSSLKLADKKDLRETRSLKGFNIKSMTFIYGSKVATIKLVEKEIIGVLIDDKSLANDQRQIFEVLWKAAI